MAYVSLLKTRDITFIHNYTKLLLLLAKQCSSACRVLVWNEAYSRSVLKLKTYNFHSATDEALAVKKCLAIETTAHRTLRLCSSRKSEDFQPHFLLAECRISVIFLLIYAGCPQSVFSADSLQIAFFVCMSTSLPTWNTSSARLSGLW